MSLLSTLQVQASTEELRVGAHTPARQGSHTPSASYVPVAQASQHSSPETFHGTAWCPGTQHMYQQKKNVRGLKDAASSASQLMRSSRYIRYRDNIGDNQHGESYNIGDNQYSSKNLGR